ncbi:hypothetical protein CPB83DRAFT_845804 [Crepidotus variabilis]|uniref:SNF5-domain-containing protein n=1 Tax=Crepidotus variabilis TaxID=179855 RepID=A0A9P6EQ86_9AGAR|nr:hypothetical protein CPB83DRAFT_845804 [Crepidotus variabilis]
MTNAPLPKNAAQPMRATKPRPSRTTTLPSTPNPYQQPRPPQIHYPLAAPLVQVPLITKQEPSNPPLPPLPTQPQAYTTSYDSRLNTGVSLLVQPNLASAAATSLRTSRRTVNYADPGSGDEFPDAGAIDSEDDDFLASGGVRTSIRQSRSKTAASLGAFKSAAGVSTPRQNTGTPQPEKSSLEKSYLGLFPPPQFIKSTYRLQATPEFTPAYLLEAQAQRRTSLVPIRVEFETDHHRIRDCFVWNINETLIKPETFATTFCNDLGISSHEWASTIATQIRAQLEDHESVAAMELGLDGALAVDEPPPNGEEVPECRVIVSLDVQIANHHLMDHIEWDLLSPLTPEEFSIKLCAELGLAGEAIPLVAHAIHEELMKHKKDVIEWGVVGGEKVAESVEDPNAPRDKSGHGLMKDKTGLGLGLGRAPRDGRGPKTLRSVWRDWAEAEEFRTTFEELTAEDLEKREIERERATRRLRRETSKFQSSTRTRRR